MRILLVVLLTVSIFSVGLFANLTIYEAISLGQLHGAEDAEGRGFVGSILFGTIGAAIMNRRSIMVPASRLAYVSELTDNRAVTRAYEQSYQNSYRNTVAANTWHGYVIASVITTILYVLLLLPMMSGY